VRTEGLADYLASRRADPAWRGCNVTMPHKQAVIPLLDRLDPLAARIGAVNTVVPEDGALVGYNTDAPGFMEPLKPWLEDTHLLRMARVMGTGGAARAIVAALADAGFIVVLAGRDPAKAQALLDELARGNNHHAVDIAHFADPTDFAFDDRAQLFDLVVNASLLGMAGQPPLAYDLSHTRPARCSMTLSPVRWRPICSPARGGRVCHGRWPGDAGGPGRPCVSPFLRGHAAARGGRCGLARTVAGARPGMSRPFVLGLTGSIGMGKSAVADMMREAGVPVFDADAQVHRLQGPGGALLPAIEAAFPGTTGPAGVDRGKLGALVFGDKAALARLERSSTRRWRPRASRS
jgi:hypothetical protein